MEGDLFLAEQDAFALPISFLNHYSLTPRFSSFWGALFGYYGAHTAPGCWIGRKG